MFKIFLILLTLYSVTAQAEWSDKDASNFRECMTIQLDLIEENRDCYSTEEVNEQIASLEVYCKADSIEKRGN